MGVAVGRAVVEDQRPRERRGAASVPSWASVAEPLKSIGSPTAQVRLEVGAVIVAVGGVFPAEIATVSVAEAPWVSVTLRPTW